MTELLCYWCLWLAYVVIVALLMSGFLLGSISTVALLMSGFGVLVFVQLLCCWCFWLACVAELLCYTRGYLPWLPGCRPAL